MLPSRSHACGSRLDAWYRRRVPRFVRVANRRGWEVEVVQSAAIVETRTLASRGEALAYAESLQPDWIEIGDLVDVDTPGQRHSWTTLRRGPDGTYETSLLRWQAKRGPTSSAP